MDKMFKNRRNLIPAAIIDRHLRNMNLTPRLTAEMFLRHISNLEHTYGTVQVKLGLARVKVMITGIYEHNIENPMTERNYSI